MGASRRDAGRLTGLAHLAETRKTLFLGSTVFPLRTARQPESGVHPPAGERLPRPGALRAEPRDRRCPAAGAQRAVADGRADPQEGQITRLKLLKRQMYRAGSVCL